MRILVIHQFFLGKGDSGGSRWNQFAKYWAARGHEITVIAGDLHYSTGSRHPGCEGKLFVQQAEGPGVQVLRCHVSKYYQRGTVGRAWAWLTFLFSGLAAGVMKAPRPDVVLATSPPLMVSVIMWLLSAYYRVPAIFEVRDLWPDCIIDMGLLTSRLVQRIFFKLEWIGYHRSRWINVLTPAFERWLVERKGIRPGLISMIPNGADLDLMSPGPRDNWVREKLDLDGKFVLSYFGAHGWANRLDQLLDLAGLIKDDMPDVRILLVGGGAEKPALQERAEREELDNVVFVDPVPKEQVGDYINASDVCTAVLQDGPHGPTVYPNKVFDYMSCGRATLIGVKGVARKLVEDANAGLYAEPENPADLKRALGDLRADPERTAEMGRNGLEFVRKHFARDVLAERYLEILTHLAERAAKNTA